MKCTDCQTEVKPVVAIDIDGTLGDYHGHFTRFVSQYYNVRFDGYKYDGAVTFKEWFAQRGIDVNAYRQAKLAYRQGGWKRNMPTFDDWLTGKFPLLPAGTEVWIATTRPYMRLDNIDPDTQEWLSRIGFKYDALLYGENKYERLIDRVGKQRIAFILDDLPEQYDAADELGLPVWQIARQHNSAEAAQRARRLYARDATHTIAKAIDQWRETEGHGTGASLTQKTKPSSMSYSNGQMNSSEKLMSSVRRLRESHPTLF